MTPPRDRPLHTHIWTHRWWFSSRNLTNVAASLSPMKITPPILCFLLPGKPKDTRVYVSVSISPSVLSSPARAAVREPICRRAYEQQNLLLTVLKAAKSEIKAPTDLVSGEGSLPGSRCVLTWWKGRKLSGVSFIRKPTPLIRALPSGPQHPPEAQPPNITLRARRTTYKCPGDANIQSLTRSLCWSAGPFRRQKTHQLFE